MDTVKTMLLMTILTMLLVVVGNWLGGQTGLILGLAVAVVTNFFAYWYSDRLAMTLTGARPAGEDELPEVYQELRSLTRDAGMPMPAVAIIPNDQPNAFAAGRNPAHAVVAVTRGLVRLMDSRQLRGVLAHELAHIKNRDILISTIAAIMAGTLAVVARLGIWQIAWGGRGRRLGNPLVGILSILALVMAPMAAALIQLAISRTREFGADQSGADISGDPEGLASALERLGQTRPGRAFPVNEATAHMFIVNPLSAGTLSGLFQTHPPIADRVRRLRGRV